MALAAMVLLVFSLVLIAIGLVALSRLRRSGRRRPSAATSRTQPEFRARSAGRPDMARAEAASPAQAPAPAGGVSHDVPGYGSDDRLAGRSAEQYPGGMDADTAEIERLKAEIAELRAHNGEGSPGLKRTQALVAVAANVSGILGLLVSVAALIK